MGLFFVFVPFGVNRLLRPFGVSFLGLAEVSVRWGGSGFLFSLVDHFSPPCLTFGRGDGWSRVGCALPLGLLAPSW